MALDRGVAKTNSHAMRFEPDPKVTDGQSTFDGQPRSHREKSRVLRAGSQMKTQRYNFTILLYADLEDESVP